MIAILHCRTLFWLRACSGCSTRTRVGRSTSMSFFRHVVFLVYVCCICCMFKEVKSKMLNFYRQLSNSFPVLKRGRDIHWESTSGLNYAQVFASRKQLRDPVKISVEECENNWDCRREAGLDLHSLWWGRRRFYGFWWGGPDCPRTIQVSSKFPLLLLLNKTMHCHFLFVWWT